MHRSTAIAVIAALLAVPSAALAGPDEDMRDAARAEAARLRAEGWPIERCYLGVNFYNNVVTYGNGSIRAGDRLTYVGATSVEGATTEQVANALAPVPANSTVLVRVERDGAPLDLEQQCGNLADYHRTYLTALDFAGDKDWYDCIDALAGRPEDPQYLNLRIRCASVARRGDEYPVQQWTDTAVQRVISGGRYAEESRASLAETLLKSRMQLSPTVYASLVNEVVQWDGGVTWEGVQPDIGALRQAAERGVRNRLIDPQSAIIEMPYDFIYGTWTPAFANTSFEGFMTCGMVNARNRMGGYTGSTFFISVIDEAGFPAYTDMDSASSDYYRPVDAACGQLTRKLTYIGEDVATDEAPATAAAPAPSIADELRALSELHASGALSDEEFDAAKARVLSGT